MSTKESDPLTAMVELTVTDSGKGISKAYMETKMFTSFAQEDALSPYVTLSHPVQSNHANCIFALGELALDSL